MALEPMAGFDVDHSTGPILELDNRPNFTKAHRPPVSFTINGTMGTARHPPSSWPGPRGNSPRRVMPQPTAPAARTAATDRSEPWNPAARQHLPLPTSSHQPPQPIQLTATSSNQPSNRHRRFACEKCPNAFLRKRDLERHNETKHMKEHMEERRYTCDQPACPRDGKPFSRRDNLLKHMQFVHGIKKKTEGSKETADEHNKRSSPENEAQQSSSSKGKRKGDAVSVSSDDCSEPETQNLRDEVRRLKNEMRSERARFELALRDERERTRKEMDEMRKKHDEEIKAQQERHQLTEDRLMALVERLMK
jgi:hypothetical protein